MDQQPSFLNDSRRAGARGGLAPHNLQRALAFIEANLETSLQVRQLAAICHLSQFHFARQFRKSTGQSPHKYIVLRRMELAKELLANGGIPISEVTRRVGFRTQAHFTDSFRVHVGVPPGRYRRELCEPQLADPVAPIAALQPADVLPVERLQ